MAKGNRQLRRRSRLPARRARSGRYRRELHKAVNLRPTIVRLPADPPRTQLSHEYSAIIPINIQLDPATPSSGFDSFGNDFNAAIYKIKAVNTQIFMTPANLRDLVISFMGYASNIELEIRLNKVSAWGPTDLQVAVELAPVLTVDVSRISTSTTVTDRGTSTNRSRCGVSLPFSIWFDGSETYTIIWYYADTSQITVAEAKSMGVFHVSLSWRRSSKHTT